MERVTVRIPTGMLDDVEQLVERGEFVNRSEAIRDALRGLDGVRDHRTPRRLYVSDGGAEREGAE